ncbi:hypothetical protein AVEN_209470-1 [Araneus ventricosus]|uniref:Uncharacterized protein n=1 Tax=Araneus ventricosus TaxID=182803 RepID=A0A4Y2HC20_ARAVE|nr:hypothetical protein AVEN_209470-1 [Araneus ventricosus]
MDWKKGVTSHSLQPLAVRWHQFPSCRQRKGRKVLHHSHNHLQSDINSLLMWSGQEERLYIATQRGGWHQFPSVRKEKVSHHNLQPCRSDGINSLL